MRESGQAQEEAIRAQFDRSIIRKASNLFSHHEQIRVMVLEGGVKFLVRYQQSSRGPDTIR